jgi:hypothetical protein
MTVENNTELYGKISGEENVLESIKSREIVQEILRFGVSQNQILKIIYFLCLELEDRETLESLSDIIRPILFEEKEKKQESIIME